MKLISHRGNLNGSKLNKENDPNYIQEAIDNGFDCEVDIWKINNDFFLGHDSPDYLIYKSFLYDIQFYLWIHCKNFEAFSDLSQDFRLKANVFFHNQDDYTLTSNGIIWAFPNRKVDKNCVIVKLEYDPNFKTKVYGICSDFVINYRS